MYEDIAAEAEAIIHAEWRRIVLVGTTQTWTNILAGFNQA